MTHVEFFPAASAGNDALMELACELAARAYRDGRKVYIQAADKEAAEAIDERLWTRDLDQFLPHNLVGEGPKRPPPVQIGFDKPPGHHHDLFINLQTGVPEHFSHFRSLYELVPDDEAGKENARERFRFYKQRGYPLKYHQ